jgi:hypothetical protein
MKYVWNANVGGGKLFAKQLLDAIGDVSSLTLLQMGMCSKTVTTESEHVICG